MKNRWKFTALALALAGLLGSCAPTARLASSGASDDLYASHDRKAIAAAEQAALERQRQIREQWALKNIENAGKEDYYYDDILSESYQDSYERRLRGFQSLSYKLPGSYYDFYYSDKSWATSGYDPAFYNVIVMGDEVWVEPRYITSMFGNWGSSVNINIGWGWNDWYRPYWGWDYYSHWNRPWGWNYGWNSPYYGWGWGSHYHWGYDPYYWNYPHWGWGGHSHWNGGNHHWSGSGSGSRYSTLSSSNQRGGTMGGISSGNGRGNSYSGTRDNTSTGASSSGYRRGSAGADYNPGISSSGTSSSGYRRGSTTGSGSSGITSSGSNSGYRSSGSSVNYNSGSSSRSSSGTSSGSSYSSGSSGSSSRSSSGTSSGSGSSSSSSGRSGSSSSSSGGGRR